MKSMKHAGLTSIISVVIIGTLLGQSARQTAPGEGNQYASQLSLRSPMVKKALGMLVTQVKRIKDQNLRQAALDAIQNDHTCIQHRANLTPDDKQKTLRKLSESGLLDPRDETAFPGGWLNGVFPPVLDDHGPCPHLPQPFSAAPGGEFGGHHSYPGGLAIHEANNQIAALNLRSEYLRMYGGLSTPTTIASRADIVIDEDWLIGAPVFHDWAKSIVYQWNMDGSEFQEMDIGGNGMTDDYGSPGDSRTGAHHILGIAESMKRGLDPGFVITQASAHSAPSGGNEFKVVNWLRAAAIVARIDPVQKGYLMKDPKNQLRLPPLRKLVSSGLSASGQVNMLVEYELHNLSDADNNFSVPAAASVDIILRDLAADFGFNPLNRADYNNKFRNPVLSFLTGERLFILYSANGRDGVRQEIESLRRQRVF